MSSELERFLRKSAKSGVAIDKLLPSGEIEKTFLEAGKAGKSARRRNGSAKRKVKPSFDPLSPQHLEESSLNPDNVRVGDKVVRKPTLQDVVEKTEEAKENTPKEFLEKVQNARVDKFPEYAPRSVPRITLERDNPKSTYQTAKEYFQIHNPMNALSDLLEAEFVEELRQKRSFSAIRIMDEECVKKIFDIVNVEYDRDILTFAFPFSELAIYVKDQKSNMKQERRIALFQPSKIAFEFLEKYNIGDMRYSDWLQPFEGITPSVNIVYVNLSLFNSETAYEYILSVGTQLKDIIITTRVDLGSSVKQFYENMTLEVFDRIFSVLLQGVDPSEVFVALTSGGIGLVDSAPNVNEEANSPNVNEEEEKEEAREIAVASPISPRNTSLKVRYSVASENDIDNTVDKGDFVIISEGNRWDYRSIREVLDVVTNAHSHVIVHAKDVSKQRGYMITKKFRKVFFDREGPRIASVNLIQTQLSEHDLLREVNDGLEGRRTETRTITTPVRNDIVRDLISDEGEEGEESEEGSGLVLKGGVLNTKRANDLAQFNNLFPLKNIELITKCRGDNVYRLKFN